MADIIITPTSIIAGGNSDQEAGIAGETVTAGKVVYRDRADGRYKLADSNSVTAAIRSPRGIALHGAAIGQPLTIHRDGDITIGAALTAGVTYYLSDTPGGICPVADVGAGEYPAVVGMAKSVSVLAVQFQEAGVAL